MYTFSSRFTVTPILKFIWRREEGSPPPLTLFVPYTTFKKSTAIWKVRKVRLRYIILVNYLRCLNEQPRAYKKMKELLLRDFRWGFADFSKAGPAFIFRVLAGFRVEFTSRQCCGSVTFWCGQRIRIRGAVPQINGSGYFCQWASRWQLKIMFFAYYFLKLHLHHFSKIKSHKKSQYSRNQGFSCLMTSEGSGSVPRTNGSGRPKTSGSATLNQDICIV